MLAPAAVTQHLHNFHDLLSSLSGRPREWEAQYAASVAERCLSVAPASRGSLFEVMEASLGVTDRKVARLLEELENELCVEAPSEFEHYRVFRLRTQLKPIQSYQEWQECIAHDGEWQLMHNSGESLIAVSISRACLLTTIPSFNDPQLILARHKYAYTKLGLGQAAFEALHQACSPITELAKFQDSALKRLPKLEELFIRQETREEQLTLWSEIMNQNRIFA